MNVTIKLTVIAPKKTLPFEIRVHVVIAMVLGQVHEHTGGTAPLSGPAETAVTDAPARGAMPLLEENHHTSATCSHRSEKR